MLTDKLSYRLKLRNLSSILKFMKTKKYQITDKDDNEVLSDANGSLLDFVQECERMISLYKDQRYTQAEQLRDKLSERLDDVMRGY